MESISARARIGCRVNPAEFLLAGVIVARSTSLLLSKALLTTMSPLNILSVRFCLAFVILCAIFFNRMKRMDLRTLLMGMAIGGWRRSFSPSSTPSLPPPPFSKIPQ